MLDATRQPAHARLGPRAQLSCVMKPVGRLHRKCRCCCSRSRRKSFARSTLASTRFDPTYTIGRSVSCGQYCVAYGVAGGRLLALRCHTARPPLRATARARIGFGSTALPRLRWDRPAGAMTGLDRVVRVHATAGVHWRCVVYAPNRLTAEKASRAVPAWLGSGGCVALVSRYPSLQNLRVNVEKRRGWEMGKDAPRGIENAWLWPFVWQVPSARTHARSGYANSRMPVQTHSRARHCTTPRDVRQRCVCVGRRVDLSGDDQGGRGPPQRQDRHAGVEGRAGKYSSTLSTQSTVSAFPVETREGAVGGGRACGMCAGGEARARMTDE